MKVTPLDVEQHDFSRAFYGYDEKEVRDFLKLVRETLEALIEENQRLKEEARLKEAELSGVRGKEALLNETLLTTQKACEEMKAAARKEAACIVSQAEIEAERLVHHANDRLVKLMQEIAELKRQRITLSSELRHLLDMHVKFLDALEEEEASAEEEMRKIEVIPKGALGGN